MKKIKPFYQNSKLSKALNDFEKYRKANKPKKSKKTSKVQHERKLVNKLIGELQEITELDLLIEIDTDSQQRVFKSGYDFTIAYNGRIEYFEAKRSIGKPVKDPLKLLTPYQRIKAFECCQALMSYEIIEFVVPPNKDAYVYAHTVILYSGQLVLAEGCSVQFEFMEYVEYLVENWEKGIKND